MDFQLCFFLYKCEFNELHSSLRRACSTCSIRAPQLKYLGGFLRLSFKQYLKAATSGADLITSTSTKFQALIVEGKNVIIKV